jgi:hypothetical protein
VVGDIFLVDGEKEMGIMKSDCHTRAQVQHAVMDGHPGDGAATTKLFVLPVAR